MATAVRSISYQDNTLPNHHRYAFDVIGELYFGSMFGFMKERQDRSGFLEASDILLPPLVVACVLPAYTRFFLPLFGSILSSARKAQKDVQVILNACETCVPTREQEIRDGEVSRKDILTKMMEIRDKKGKEIDFTTRHVQQEVFTAMLVFQVESSMKLANGS